MVSFVDKLLNCRDCGKEFVFTAGEQQFYASKGLQHEPRRCGDCRGTRRQTDGAGGGGGGGGGAGRPPRVMHDVMCDGCGRLTQVPFVPTGNRPVYCMDCFQNNRR
jgi:CxxC-x17-CxxC domain-containing protein